MSLARPLASRILLTGVLTALMAVTTLAGAPAARAAAAPPQQGYTLYVAAESDDVVEKIAFGPGGLRLVKSVPVGVWPTETEGPHGLAISADGRHWYVTVAHGNPYGILFKYDTETDEYVSEVKLGLFPATMSVSPSTGRVPGAHVAAGCTSTHPQPVAWGSKPAGHPRGPTSTHAVLPD